MICRTVGGFLLLLFFPACTTRSLCAEAKTIGNDLEIRLREGLFCSSPLQLHTGDRVGFSLRDTGQTFWIIQATEPVKLDAPLLAGHASKDLETVTWMPELVPRKVGSIVLVEIDGGYGGATRASVLPSVTDAR